MQHFFVDASQVSEETIRIEGTDVNHMKNVLRMRIGEEVTVSDGQGKEYLCQVRDFEEEQVQLKIVETKASDAELPSKIYLFQGLPKQEKMELIVQKCVELGIYAVVPVSMKRCVVKLDAKKGAKKVERWNTIAASAAKQSGRGIVPEVMSVKTYKEALEMAKDLDVVLVPYECAEGMDHTKELIQSIKPGQSVGMFIGPEGGFDPDEIALACETGGQVITLGKRILRTETAGLALLSVLMFPRLCRRCRYCSAACAG